MLINEKVSVSSDSGTSKLYLSSNAWTNKFRFAMTNDGIALVAYNSDETSNSYIQALKNLITISSPNGASYVYPHQGFASVSGDGVKTYKQLLEELVAKTDFSKFTMYTNLTIGANIYTISVLSNNYRIFTQNLGSTNAYVCNSVYFSKDTTQSPNAFVRWDINNVSSTCTDQTNFVPSPGTSIYIYY